MYTIAYILKRLFLRAALVIRSITESLMVNWGSQIASLQIASVQTGVKQVLFS